MLCRHDQVQKLDWKKDESNKKLLKTFRKTSAQDFNFSLEI